MLNTAFILAAGLGNRMRPLTEHCAKPTLYYQGERLIERHLRRLSVAGFRHAVINCYWQGQQLRQLLGDGSTYGLGISYSCEDSAPLETASGIARAARQLGNAPFLLVNGDIWTDFDFRMAQQVQGATHHSKTHVFLTANPPHNTSGDFGLDASGYVRNTAKVRFTYTGMSIFDISLLQGAEQSGAKLADIFRRCAAKGELQGSMLNAQWLDIGHPAVITQQLSRP